VALDVVTGACSYTGRAIAEALLERGRQVRSLSRRPPQPDDPLAGRVAVGELQFADEAALKMSLEGAQTLYNTYWIRFERGETTYERTVGNSRRLFAAAAAGGVERIVHVSVTNPSEGSRLPYFRGKARVEAALAELGVPAAVVRPTLVFGRDDILLSNIAWALRRSPVFAVAGDGRYRVQPVAVEDVARIAVGLEAGETVDAAGPETFSFEELVRRIAAAIGRRARIVHVPDAVVLGAARAIGTVRRDVLLTREELAGLRASLLVSSEPPRGRRRLGDWLAAEGAGLGRRYVSELARNFRPYRPL
jgi:uncharacterized protein YbjT (DUF2867 family)